MFPFDSQTPAGYVVAVISQFTACIFVFLFLANVTSLGLGAFIFLTAMVKDSKGILNLISTMAKHKEKHSKLFKPIVHFMDLHSDLKELSVQKFVRKLGLTLNLCLSFFSLSFHRVARNFSDILQPIFMVVFTSSFATMCAALLTIQVELVKYFLRIGFSSGIPIFLLNSHSSIIFP